MNATEALFQEAQCNRDETLNDIESACSHVTENDEYAFIVNKSGFRKCSGCDAYEEP